MRASPGLKMSDFWREFLYWYVMGHINKKDLAILKFRLKELQEVDTKNMTSQQLKEHTGKIIKLRARMADL